LIALLQRVTHAQVSIKGQLQGEIGTGILALVAVVRTDTEANADRLLQRLLGYRLFSDAAGRMNLNVGDLGGGLLLVPQFTLAADTQKGMRPSFTPAAAPAEGKRLFEHLLAGARERHPLVACGVFGADMQVNLTNDGPVTFWLEG
jgi:D-tyrosyl-tRNA(Tyr) deacylase